MTLNKMGRRAAAASLASILSAMGLSLTACSRDYTVGYVYTTTSQANPGLISGYKVDYQSGTLNVLADSPIPSGGKNPIAIVASPDAKSLYSIHRDDSTVVFFAIGTDGKLYAQHTYNVSGSFPTAAAIDAAGKFLYVAFTYQNNPSPDNQPYTPANPGPGGIAVFAIGTDGSLGAPITVNVGRNPVGIVANSKNRNVYVIEQDAATTSNLLGFTADATTGNLTPLPGVTIRSGNVASTGFPTGVTPSGIIEDASATHLYITDQTANTVTAYSIAANGVPSLIANGSARTDAGPLGMSFDLSGKYLYVANSIGGTIGGYSLGSNGEPVPSTASGSVQAGTGTNCVTVIGAPNNSAPTHAVYLYASNALSNSVTGEQLNPADGSLRQIQNTPFAASGLPTCVVSVPALPH